MNANVKIQISVPNSDGSTTVGYVDLSDIVWEMPQNEWIERAPLAETNSERVATPNLRRKPDRLRTPLKQQILHIMQSYPEDRIWSVQELMKLTGSRHHANIYTPLQKLVHDGKIHVGQFWGHTKNGRAVNRYALSSTALNRHKYSNPRKAVN